MGFDGLEDALYTSFDAARVGLAGGSPVVMFVTERDLLGHGDAADAASAHAVLGLVRGLATEGIRDGWQINALAVPHEDMEPDWMVWAGRLADPQGASGTVVHLGPGHLGRVPI
jgi:NAD(P)-dependent dehydrogenase (short-subunit alcohol dehydrogenase family)